MPQNIGQFVSNFYGGTRPNRFRISGTVPNAIGEGFIETHCVSTSLPESNVGIIPIPFRGRIYKFPGDRSYNEWTVTILDDVGPNQTWQTFHDWSNRFNNHETNLADGDRTFGDAYCTDLQITHLDHASDIELKQIQLYSAWPVSVGPVTLDMGAANQLASFQVTIAYTYYKVLPQTQSVIATPATSPTT